MDVSKKSIIVVGLLIFGFAFLTQSIFGWMNVGTEDMRLENTGVGVTYGFDAHPLFHSNGSRSFYFATRAGIRYVPVRGGDSRFAETFSFTRPHMATRGEVVAVGELDRGRAIYVYDSDGHLYTAPLESPVRGFFINEAGYLSVITTTDDGYAVKLFNTDAWREPFFTWYFYRTSAMRSPVAADVSEDGQVVAIAYLNLSRQLTTEIEFMCIDRSVRRFGTEALFAEEEFQDEILLSMRFMADSKLLIITDRRVTVRRIDGNDVQEVWTVMLYNRLDQLAFSAGTQFAFVAGAALYPDGRNADPIGTVNIFDMSGLTGRFYLGRRATHLSLGQGAVLVGADRYFHAVSAGGESLWHHSVPHDVRGMYFLDNTNTVLIAGANRANVWRRQRGRDGDADEYS